MSYLSSERIICAGRGLHMHITVPERLVICFTTDNADLALPGIFRIPSFVLSLAGPLALLLL